ncbi:MAG: T9SS type A sorting domain-containing protein [Candidatus Marinimicrobia bacterium]|nr:T9SS type A sorting domain-containing protein [Candidatus Neomarinimicrobiota bacterium]
MGIRHIIVFSFISFSILYPQTDKPTEFCSKALGAGRMLKLQSTLTENQEKIDITYYRIELDIDFDDNEINGSVQINGLVGMNQPDSIELDFTTSLTVDSVLLYDQLTNYVHENDLLKIPAPDETIPEGYEFQLTVYYHGTPPTSGFGSFVFDEHNGVDHVWTLSEPYGARNWWPCKDDPSDKADSVDIFITVPENQIVASNGKLISETDLPNNRKQYHWKESYPICTYLVSLAIYPYTVWQDVYVSATGDSMPLIFYVYPDHFDAVQTNYLKTKDMITLFARKFGEYPFMGEKYGHAEFGWGGGMEHQTLTSLGGYSEWLIAHELAHQWWGDMITCASFHHIWLNEGFARYGEALWDEFTGGVQAYKTYMNNHTYYGPGTIYVENPVSVGDIFHSGLSYNKAGWVVHMLRHVVGDSVFFEILHSYASNDSLAYASATTEDFQSVCEDVSGLNLNDFFQQWIYGEKYPQYRLSWIRDATDGYIIQIDQLQTTGYFHMPIDLHITGPNLDTIIVIDNDGHSQSYQFGGFGTIIDDITLDPDNWILKEVNYVSIAEENNLPQQISMSPVYPNPFNSTALISVNIPEIYFESQIHIDVFDLTGRMVANIFSGSLNSNNHQFQWNASAFSSGVYFIQMKTQWNIQTQKVLLIK